MNKLVSKNPVLRFKLDKKIVKALLGSALKSVLGSTITGLVVGRYLNRHTNNSKKRVSAKIGYGPAPGFNPDGTPDYSVTHLKWNENPNTGEWVSGLYVKNGNRYWKGSDGTTTLMGPNDGPIKKPVKPLRRNPSRRNPVRSTPTVTESVNHPEDMLPVNDFLSKQENLTLNIPTAPSARQAVLGKDYGTYWDSPASRIDDALFLIKNLNRKAELRTSPVTYDRSGTRDWIRTNLGRGAYEYTGAQRRALRYWLNGDKDGLNYDKNLLEVFGNLSLYAKQGAKLVSRNPIERFLQGRNLPTAPKAEDRYKNGRRDSVAYLTLTPDELGRSIKRVVTPNNAKIQREIIFNRGAQDNDTIYTEVPEHDKWKLFPIKTNVKPRKGFSFAPTPEYEILKRRFNTAWNLAK